MCFSPMPAAPTELGSNLARNVPAGVTRRIGNSQKQFSRSVPCILTRMRPEPGRSNHCSRTEVFCTLAAQLPNCLILGTITFPAEAAAHPHHMTTTGVGVTHSESSPNTGRQRCEVLWPSDTNDTDGVLLSAPARTFGTVLEFCDSRLVHFHRLLAAACLCAGPAL